MRSRLDSPLPLSPLFLFLFYFPLVPVVQKLAKKTLVSSRCKMILFMNWHSIVDTSWSRSSKYSNQCPLWRRKMFVDSYAYKTITRLHEIFNTNTPIICKFYKRISTMFNYLYAQLNTRQTIWCNWDGIILVLETALDLKSTFMLYHAHNQPCVLLLSFTQKLILILHLVVSL